MGPWVEQNLPALCVGAGLGAIIAHWFYPEGFAWLLGAFAGIGIALVVWQNIGGDKDR